MSSAEVNSNIAADRLERPRRRHQQVVGPETGGKESQNNSFQAKKATFKSSNSSSNETVICFKAEQPAVAEAANSSSSGSSTWSSMSSAQRPPAPEGSQENGEQQINQDCAAKEADSIGEQKQRKFFKSFFLFTSYLNPFQQQETPASRNRKRASLDLDEEQQPQRSIFHLNLLNFAHRYFGGGGGSARNSRGQLYCSKSVPNTPLKGLPNGYNQDSASAAASSQPAKQQLGKPSVRFEACPVKQDEGHLALRAGRRQDARLRFADRDSQTTEVVHVPPAAEAEQSNSEDELDSSELVSKLFRVSQPEEAGECPMNSERFRQHGYSLIDYISNYLDTINKRRVTPLNIEPGYLKNLIQATAPEKGESFGRIMQDFESHIMCGITHWQHPHFHAYFPAGNAYPSILADMLSDALGCVGFSWAASPAYTELEIIMLNWMGKMIGLPDEFLCLSGQENGNGVEEGCADELGLEASSSSGPAGSRGGGVIQGSASECVLVNLLAARHWAIERLRRKYPEVGDDGRLLSKLIGYCSREAHSCVEKAAMIGFIRMRALDTDDKHALRGETLERAIREDMAQGLEPFFVCATLGTTSCVSFDNIDELGQVCRKFEGEEIWLHVDAAYAGSALICPEFKYLIKGIERASSLNMNPNKWMLINFDCSLMWVKDRFKLTRAFVVDPLYLQHSYSDQAIDYRHWGIPLSRRFRALKLWFVIRNYGLEGLQAYIRLHCRLAKLFETLILNDQRFSIMNQVVLGLVCFRLIGSNALNQRLLSMINASGRLHMVPASLNGRYVIRFCVCDQNAKDEDIHYAYGCISEFATELLESIRAGREQIRAISQQNTIDVSSVSIHTQQSVSADHIEKRIRSTSLDDSEELEAAAKSNSSVESSKQQVLVEQPQRTPENRSVSPREAARKYLLNSSARGHATHDGQPLRRPPNATLSNGSGTGTGGSSQQDQELDDELEQSIKLDSDIEDLDEEFLEPGLFASNGPQLLEDAPGPNSSRSSNRNGSGGLREHEEASDELYNLTKRRNRMSLRYKREFFVRVVSDPRVYRASISGDINARASTSSLSSQQQLSNSSLSKAPRNAQQTTLGGGPAEESGGSNK